MSETAWGVLGFAAGVMLGSWLSYFLLPRRNPTQNWFYLYPEIPEEVTLEEVTLYVNYGEKVPIQLAANCVNTVCILKGVSWERHWDGEMEGDELKYRFTGKVTLVPGRGIALLKDIEAQGKEKVE